ncbi:unnamed protein product [Knipowitschia caucasica]
MVAWKSMVSIKIEYYRSFKYSMKWKNLMNSKLNSKKRKTSKSPNNPSSSEDFIKGRERGKRQQKRSKTVQCCNTHEVNKRSIDDLLDLIDRRQDDLSVEVADEGVDCSDDDQVSVSSIMSGPSGDYDSTLNKLLTLCSVCRKLQQKAKRMKAPLKNKLLCTDPKSFSCDQWILLKPWRRKQKQTSLLDLTQLIHRLRLIKNKQKKGQNELMVEVVCMRPHPFLQRNLRHCIKNPIIKNGEKNRRKRAREDSLVPRVAKQKRTHTNRRPVGCGDANTDPMTNDVTHNRSMINDSLSSCCSPVSLESGLQDSDLTPALSVASRSFKEMPKQTVPKRDGGFKDLLAQLRGNNSMIIRETRD